MSNSKEYCCDYDAIALYRPGEFNSRYKTVLDGKIREISKEILESWEAESFLNREYKTYETIDEIILYRVFGEYKANADAVTNGARSDGRFLSTEFAESPIDAKLRLALNPAWKNTRMFEAKVIVPKGVKINVGIVAPIKTSDNTIFPGGAEQIFFKNGWSKEWILGYRRLSSRQIQAEPKYPLKKPDPIVLNDVHKAVCPMCCDTNTVVLKETERFTVIGSKGKEYVMMRHCLNEECGYYW